MILRHVRPQGLAIRDAAVKMEIVVSHPSFVGLAAKAIAMPKQNVGNMLQLPRKTVR